ncbi:unnamed protein product [Ostreobium quekettii]|uniref:ShKT domain-containing protein n=1 Tax=Ostreobium quekettii TaxID=121088 RepID=A0A8S1IYC6_9CHLO|nr:unnamed protein product [Ostreobium quekettii]|eukprot:evm.model.scf_13EXC.22 EVM.evm.TU.scf_13EXC.22   scf_13EXC:247950-250469(-)
MEQIEEAFATVISESTTVVIGGGDESEASSDATATKAAKVVAEVIVEAAQEVFCEEDISPAPAPQQPPTATPPAIPPTGPQARRPVSALPASPMVRPPSVAPPPAPMVAPEPQQPPSSPDSPLATPSPPEEAMCLCSDFAPPGAPYTCAQQRDWGKCEADWMRDDSMYPEGYCQITCGLCPCAKPMYRPGSPETPVPPKPAEDVTKKSEDRCSCSDIPPRGSKSTCAEQRSFGKCNAIWMRSTAEIPEAFCQVTCGRCPCKDPAVSQVSRRDSEGFPDTVFLCGEGVCSDTPVVKDAVGIAVAVGPVKASGPLGVPGNFPLDFGICGSDICITVPIRTM